LNVDITKEFTHISLCAGYGGIDIGLKRAIGNVRTIAFSEIEAYACANLVAKMEAGLMDTAPIWTNLKTFPWKDFYGKVDILSGGFPCQPFSSSGRREGDEDPRHLFPHIVKGIKELGKPPIIFLENVEGIISSKLKSQGWSDPIGTPVLLHVLRELERLDYTATAGVFSACEVGAPHQRKRVFILAVANKLTNQGWDIVSSAIKRTDDNRTTSPLERYYSREYRTAFPSFRGQEQYEWEAPRTILYKSFMDDSIYNRLQTFRNKPRLDKQEDRKEETSNFTDASKYTSPHEHVQGLSESEMGGTTNGTPCRVDTGELFSSYDNRTDELRLLGNGVVPDTAKRAFTELWQKLADPKR